MTVSLSTVGDPRDMHPVVRDEVYRIAYEAIRNACTHSAATHLQIELRYSQELTLRVSGAFVFLLTWRVARRFGGLGLAVLLVTCAVFGPLRDSWFMARFPEWGSYAPGIAPMLAISVAYVLLGILGHGTMRLVAGPAAADRLARRPWESA